MALATEEKKIHRTVREEKEIRAFGCFRYRNGHLKMMKRPGCGWSEARGEGRCESWSRRWRDVSDLEAGAHAFAERAYF